MGFFQKLFDTSDFPARWNCGQWTPELGWLHIISDLLIFAAYFAIPVALAVIAFRRRDVSYGLILALFIAFILACGTTHLIEAMIFWFPVYRLSGLAKAITAVISIITAIVLIRSLPSLLTLTGLRDVNTDLKTALAREAMAREELTSARDTLERRTSEMTQRIRRVTTAFASSRCVACRWNAETGAIDWEIGYGEACRQCGVEAPVALNSFQDLLTPEDFAHLRAVTREVIAKGTSLDFDGAVASEPNRHIRLSGTPEPPIEGQPRHLNGMFRYL